MQERFNRYSPTKQITSKPSGSVYLAHPTNHASQKVVLKVFEAAHFASDPQKFPFDPQTKNFLYQIARLRQLRHSSIVPILDVGVEQGQPYVVREYLASDSLRHLLDDLSPQGLDLQDALKIIFQVGQALHYAHQHQILHGNLKPENIFFNDNGEVLLADFGLASFTDVTKLDNQPAPQTLSYLALEQLVGSITKESDQYALGCLTYELITGRVPFSTQFSSPIISLPSGNGESANAIEGAESFCENRQCLDYGKVGRDNVRKFGRTRKGTQRWQCKTCRTTWTFSPMQATDHPDLTPLSDLVPNLPEPIEPNLPEPIEPNLPEPIEPNLPEPIEKVVLKAMAKDPSQRYTDISIFLNALQVAWLSPTTALTSSSVTPLPTRMMESEAPFTTPTLEHWNHVRKDHRASKFQELPDSGTYQTSTTLAKPHLGAYLSNKAEAKPHSDAYFSSRDLVETLPEGRRPRPSKPVTPILWLAFALSGIALLLGTMILYALVPSDSPGSTKPIKSSPTALPSAQATTIPTAQPVVHVTTIPTAQPPTVIATSGTSYEAEAPGNTLAAGARVVGCPICSGGDRVGYIGLNAGVVGTLQFNNVNKNIGGQYTLTIYYIIAGSDKLALYISVNGGPAVILNVPSTANGNIVGTASITVNLNAGNNTITFSNPSSPAPDIDRIVV